MAEVERGNVREVNLMPIKVERILFRVGEGSLAVTLPKPWITYNGLKPGDKVEIVVDDGVMIKIKEDPGVQDNAEI